MTKTLPILIVAATYCLITTWGDAAPPRQRRANSTDLRSGPQNELPRVDFALAQADSPAENTADQPTTADGPPEDAQNKATALAALQKARELLTKHNSVRANVIETVEIANHSFTATGRYLQRGETKMRLEFDLQIGQTRGALMEVCDGEILYTRHIIGEEIHLTRRNVREIMEAAQAAQAETAELFIAEMGLGGLPGMLAALEEAMTFDVLKDDTLGDKSVWMIQGTWNKQLRDRWTAPQNGSEKSEGEKKQKTPEKTQELPTLVPDIVRIYLDRKTGFPLRFEYRKKVPGRNHTRPMLTLAFQDIELNGAIDDSEFTFIPPETPNPIELTPFYKERIRMAVQAAQQKNAPAKPDAAQPGQPTQP